ncbi:MAG TPA: GxxExxY protein [Flavobacterium sp.]|nr:GxxExxY protein [Flavobacterium sp.]
MTQIIHKDESFQIMGILFEVHNNLGGGFSEIVYKDALEYEFKKLNIPFEREKEYLIQYKDIILNHKFYADFVVYNKIILELKSCEKLDSKHIAQCINYLKVSSNKLAILTNFNNKSLEYKRIVL